MPRPTRTAPAIPTLRRCNLERALDFPPLYFASLDKRTELPRAFAHRHSYFHLLWVTRGSGRHMIDFRDHAVRDGSLFLMAPGQIHRWAVESRTQGFLFNFNAELFAAAPGHSQLSDELLRARVHLHPAFYPDRQQATDIARLIALIAAEYRRPEPGSSDIVTHLFQVLLLHALRIHQSETPAPPQQRAQGLAYRFIVQVENRFREPVGIADYAARLHVSERTLADATRRATGKTPKEIVQDRLLLEAKRLLMHSDMMVSEVAYHLNFDDPAYFGRFFRKHATVSPGQFKRVALEAALDGQPVS